MTPHAATPGARRCGDYHGFSAALLKPWREQPQVSAAPSSRDQRPPPAAAPPPRAPSQPAPGRPAPAPLHSSAQAASGFSKALGHRQTDGSAKKKSQSVSTAFAWRCRPIHIARSLYPALRGQVLPRCGGHVECGSSPSPSGGAFFLPFHPLLRAFRTSGHSCVALSHPRGHCGRRSGFQRTVKQCSCPTKGSRRHLERGRAPSLAASVPRYSRRERG